MTVNDNPVASRSLALGTFPARESLGKGQMMKRKEYMEQQMIATI